MKKKLIVFFLLLVLAVTLAVAFQSCSNDPVEDNGVENNTNASAEKTILYAVADFSENIYDDKDFLELIEPYRMFYKIDNVEYSLLDGEVEKMGVWAQFFSDFLDVVRRADHNAYNGMFFDGYYSSHRKIGEFTMQKVYDLHVEELKIMPELDAEEYSWVTEQNLTPKYFNVKYKIKDNNGSFRLGVESDEYKPQLFILAQNEKDEVKIIDIVEYAPVYS